MELKDFLTLIGKKKGTILSVVILFILASAIFTAIQPFKYGTKSKLLVVQSYDGIVDPYVASKSNEYLSNILASVVNSDSFFFQVLNSGYRVEQNYFPTRPDKRLKEWNKTVSADAINDTGIIVVNVYHKDKYQAGQIAEAVNYILKTKNNFYHGGGDKVSVKVIDPPVISRFPVRPNIILNLSLAFALGLIFSLCYIYLLPEGKYNLRLWPAFTRRRQRVMAGKPASASKTDPRSDANEEAEDGWERVADVLAAKEIEKAPIELKEEREDLEKDLDPENDDMEIYPADGDKLNYNDIVKRGDIKNIF